MISDAMETCWRSIPNIYAMPNVIASVIGMASAMISASRHSQNPISDTKTTRTNGFQKRPHEEVDVLLDL